MLSLPASVPFLSFRFYSPLRSLLPEASNQSSDSVVCFGTLRPLRSLREVCLRAVMSFLHADYAESAEFFYFPWRITLALEGSQTSLRRESAEGRYKRGCLITPYIAFVTLFRTRRAVSLLLL